jgi:hypothetical protein
MISYLPNGAGWMVAMLGLGGILGILAHKHQPSGYRTLRSLLKSRKVELPEESKREWAIGIYEGVSPWELVESKRVENPVLTRDDVTDVNAELLADPFMIVREGVYYLFFEILLQGEEKGVIGHAVSADGFEWQYRGVVLEEDFHLSYPHVFEWNGQVYMVPESNRDFSVRLYRAVEFPRQWEFVNKLLTGHDYVDATLFRHDDMWWMFVSATRNDVLNLYYSENLKDGWSAHPMNPVVKLDKHIARPGGSVIEHEGKLYRFAQDDDPDYGIQVFAFEVVELDTKVYRERMMLEKPVVTASGHGWNAAGMHHVDLHQRDGGWMAVVDGRSA